MAVKSRKRERKNILKTRIKMEIKEKSLLEDGLTPSEKEGVYFTFGIGLEDVKAENLPQKDVLSATAEALKDLFPETYGKIKYSIKWEDTISISIPV